LSKDKVSIYIHWPFCKSKCPYCDFNSHVTESFDTEDWIRSYKQEIDSNKEYLSGKNIHTMFFGGGTPSLAPPKVITSVIEHLVTNYNVDPQVEITMEANPTSVEAANFEELNRGGVNRISLGVQSFDSNN
jgi:oxygen-independent coproporphyrinogen-3 oxidase